jgi:hypothetical protein
VGSRLVSRLQFWGGRKRQWRLGAPELPIAALPEGTGLASHMRTRVGTGVGTGVGKGLGTAEVASWLTVRKRRVFIRGLKKAILSLLLDELL